MLFRDLSQVRLEQIITFAMMKHKDQKSEREEPHVWLIKPALIFCSWVFTVHND